LSPSATVCPTPIAIDSVPVSPAVIWASVPLSKPRVTGWRWIVFCEVITGTKTFSLRNTSTSSDTIG
jgi:hypothetical protein